MMLFDVQYELGNYYDAELILKNHGQSSDYAYNFRLSKLDHYSGSVDSAVAHMLKAAALVPSNPYLKQAALSNAADLYVHDAELEKAAALYKECLSINPADFHSLMGLGWLALVGDANDSLAVRCFLFAADHLRSPDPYFKLARATEHRNPLLAKKYALEFADKASQSMYGDMYNKYLIELYCGILHTPEKALPLAKREIEVRPTAQAYAALAWTLYCNGLSTKAMQTYEGFVSGKGLEGLELYWMGKMMKGLGKGFNAVRFFKAAHKNRFDLSPAMQRDLDAQLH
jgi:tetratricopeptide (TPR) repeat protein